MYSFITHNKIIAKHYLHTAAQLLKMPRKLFLTAPGHTYCFQHKKNRVKISSVNMKEKTSNDPCWTGYEQLGMKTKKGKKVPNCIPDKNKK